MSEVTSTSNPAKNTTAPRFPNENIDADEIVNAQSVAAVIRDHLDTLEGINDEIVAPPFDGIAATLQGNISREIERAKLSLSHIVYDLSELDRVAREKSAQVAIVEIESSPAATALRVLTANPDLARKSIDKVLARVDLEKAQARADSVALDLRLAVDRKTAEDIPRAIPPTTPVPEVLEIANDLDNIPEFSARNLYKYLSEEQSATTSEVADYFGVENRKAYRALRRLQSKGLAYGEVVNADYDRRGSLRSSIGSESVWQVELDQNGEQAVERWNKATSRTSQHFAPGDIVTVYDLD